MGEVLGCVVTVIVNRPFPKFQVLCVLGGGRVVLRVAVCCRCVNMEGLCWYYQETEEIMERMGLWAEVRSSANSPRL